jgi:hypothetical protein
VVGGFGELLPGARHTSLLRGNNSIFYGIRFG